MILDLATVDRLAGRYQTVAIDPDLMPRMPGTDDWIKEQVGRALFRDLEADVFDLSTDDVVYETPTGLKEPWKTRVTAHWWPTSQQYVIRGGPGDGVTGQFTSPLTHASRHVTIAFGPEVTAGDYRNETAEAPRVHLLAGWDTRLRAWVFSQNVHTLRPHPPGYPTLGYS